MATHCIDCGKLKKSNNGKRCRECMFKNQEYREKQRKNSLRLGLKPPMAWGNKTNLGRKQSLEERKMRSEVQKRIGNQPPHHKGKDHYHWKGGITSLRVRLYSSFKHRQWRSDIFTRDNFTCQWCSKRGVILNAHHIKPFKQIREENKIETYEQALDCEELWNINNGITLCEECHNKTKNNRLPI